MKPLPELTERSALAQALRRAHLTETDAPRFGPLAGGVSSDIVLVEEGARRFVVKRALAKLKVQDDWFADVGRNRTEKRYFDYVSSVIPGAVPRVLGAEPDGGWFAMEYLGEGYSTWKQRLLAGEALPTHARRAGETLGRVHRVSWEDPLAREAFATLESFRALRIEPYLLTTAARLPAVRAELLAEAERLAATQLALVHGDFSPKNLLVSDDRFVVLDAECGWFGDPAFDTAFLVNHLFLKALFLPIHAPSILALVPVFWSAYTTELGSLANPDFEARTVRLLLCLMLARVHGKSPVEYLTLPEQRDRVTEFAATRLRRPPPTLDAVTASWSAALCGR